MLSGSGILYWEKLAFGGKELFSIVIRSPNDYLDNLEVDKYKINLIRKR